VKSAPNFFTIAASAPFAETLAKGLTTRLGDEALSLAGTIIYLPTRRAARGFGDAFAKVMGGAALLPQFRTVGDADEDELLFDAASEGIELPPAIAPLRRQLLLAHLVRQWDARTRGGALSFAQAAALADGLAAVMDEVETQGVSLDDLPSLVPADLARHWESVTGFLDLLRTAWPVILAAEQRENPAARRAKAIRLLAKRLEASPPDGMVIAAGSTGSIPATADFLGVIARLPNGAVVLPGLDRALDEESWASLDPGHPQFGMKQLLGRIGVPRADVADWHDAPVHTARETMLRETLRPAPTTDAWRVIAESGGAQIAQGLEGMALVEAADPAQEALAIALALRQALDMPGRTAALVTPDRNLARRVAAEMRRWNIAIDDSAGRPLAHASAGAFLCLLAEAAEARFAPVPLLGLLKHPFATLGDKSAEFRARARELDRWCLRGPRPDPGLDGITRAISRAEQNRAAPQKEVLAALARWWDGVAAVLKPLEDLFARTGAPLLDLIAAHVQAAERLACNEAGDCLLWQRPDGEVAAQLMASFEDAAPALPPIEPGSYPALFRNIAMKAAVRGAFGQHPRLAILGPLEARLQRFDLTILGGLNEGSWPRGAGADPWFSRPMRAALGLEQPERAIGLSAHDFAMLAAGPQVLLTRALKADGAPAIASRWLQRLQQLAGGLKLEAALKPHQDSDVARLAAQMLDVPQTPRLTRPAPRPPVSARPRRLSVTEIETWLRDPYAIYAKHVLQLRKLDALDEAIGARERGTALHKALEIFIGKYGADLPDDAALRLAEIADDVFAGMSVPRAALAVWRPRFLGAAQAFIDVERARRPDIARTLLEVRGARIFSAPGGDFTLSGQADRIDILADGTAAILDYKSGAIPSQRQIRELLAPQLPLEGAMLAAGGFPGAGKRIASELIYLSLADGKRAGKPLPVEDPAALAEKAAAKLHARIIAFDTQAVPYGSRVQPLYTNSEGDYDHLARVREWSGAGGT
jgi:ATP-dependent helicase/nuclease subunit B